MYINLIVTHNCNLRCCHCYYSKELSKETENSVYDTFVDWLDSISEIKIEKLILTGGECTLNPCLREMIRLGKEKGLRIAIFTNGVNIPLNILEICDEYYISLDGSEEIHNLIRGNNKAYRQTVNSLKVLNKLNKKIIIQTTISKWNIQHLYELIPIYKEFLPNLEQINLEGVINQGAAVVNALGISEDELELIGKFKERILEELGFKVWVKDNLYSKEQIKKFLIQKNVYFPLWVDLVRRESYILMDNYLLPFNQMSYEWIEKINENIKEDIVKKLENYNNRLMNIENLLLIY